MTGNRLTMLLDKYNNENGYKVPRIGEKYKIPRIIRDEV